MSPSWVTPQTMFSNRNVQGRVTKPDTQFVKKFKDYTPEELGVKETETLSLLYSWMDGV